MKDSRKYVAGVPRSIPEGRVVCHNVVWNGQAGGLNGFRNWTVLEDDNPEYRELCPCAWAPHLTIHYHTKREGWTEEVWLGKQKEQ